MKHYCVCMACQDLNSDSIVWAVGELDSNLLSVCACPSGHVSIVGLLHHLPDVLYMSAIRAFRHECYSESVLSFGAALERAFELFAKSYCIKAGATVDAVATFWKEIENQSERQYGAFCSAYLLIAGEPWKADTEQIKFRNRVVHKGYIATRAETEAYATYVTQRLDKLISLLHDHLENQCMDIYFFNKAISKAAIEKARQQHPGADYVGSGMPSLLHWNYANREAVTFQSALKHAETLGHKYGH